MTFQKDFVRIGDAKKELRTKEIQYQRAKIAEAGKLVKESDKWSVSCADFREFNTEKKYDINCYTSVEFVYGINSIQF